MTAGSIQLRRLFRIVNGGTPSSQPANWGGEITWVTPGDLAAQNDALIARSMRTLTDVGLRSAATLVPAGSIILSTRAPIGHIAIAEKELAFNQGCKALVPTTDLDERFFYYQLLASRPELQGLGQGVTFTELSSDALGGFSVREPPLEVQRYVAAYLDTETTRISRLLESKERFLWLLRDKRSALYAAAAAGELGSSARRRSPSGLAWIPSIPDDWKVVKLTLVARLGTGHTPSRGEPAYWEGERAIPWITTGDIERLRDDRLDILSDTKEWITQMGPENSAARLHPAGTVVLSRTASVGFSVVMGTDMTTSQDFVTWSCSSLLNPRFLLICLRAMRDDLVGRLATGSTHKTIYFPDIEGLRIPLPPVNEQDRIVQQTEREMAQLNEVVDLVSRQLPLLAERRHAMISAAVAGQIDPNTHPQPTVSA